MTKLRVCVEATRWTNLSRPHDLIQGVMLCERPKPSAVDSSPGLKPFLPSSVPSNIEPLGLVPTQKVGERYVSKHHRRWQADCSERRSGRAVRVQVFPPSLAPKQVSATSKHVKYVRNLEQENREVSWRFSSAGRHAQG